ncbi:TrbC/VirB2 family protein [Ferrimonas kyonanensis]|uniref:TrbC/VirB2 family protein n=1 Tax=Ferrimonas kyonanensis TaxID=364763 RepID=UPI0003FEAA8C|nr:TrbC/VirB2 family protein [Ferrimonas kyonanensis]
MFMDQTAPNDKVNYFPLVLMAIAALIMTGLAHAGVATTGWDSFWDELQDYATTAPGKIIAMLTFLASGYFGIVKRDWGAALGAFVFCIVLANAKTVIEDFLNAGIPVLS